MEETVARILQFTLAAVAAFGVALWFALAVWTYRDIVRRTSNIAVQVLATLVVVLGFIPGIIIYLLLRPSETGEQRLQREIEESYLAQELESTPACPNCARSIRDEFMICPNCGTVLRQACSGCGRLIDLEWRLCAFCGVTVAGRPQMSTNGRAHSRRRRSRPTGDWEVELDSAADEKSPSQQHSHAVRPAQDD